MRSSEPWDDVMSVESLCVPAVHTQYHCLRIQLFTYTGIQYFLCLSIGNVIMWLNWNFIKPRCLAHHCVYCGYFVFFPDITPTRVFVGWKKQWTHTLLEDITAIETSSLFSLTTKQKAQTQACVQLTSRGLEANIQRSNTTHGTAHGNSAISALAKPNQSRIESCTESDEHIPLTHKTSFAGQTARLLFRVCRSSWRCSDVQIQIIRHIIKWLRSGTDISAPMAPLAGLRRQY